MSLRRRTGGADEGWHLKIPAGDGRDEIRVRLGRTRRRASRAAPSIVAAWTMRAPVEPIATITTRRTRRNLLGGDGTVLAELADDQVTGAPQRAVASPSAGGSGSSSW